MRGSEVLLIAVFSTVLILTILHNNSQGSTSTQADNHAIRELRNEIDVLKTQISHSGSANTIDENVAPAMGSASAELSPALTLLGRAPQNRPSTVVRVPAPNEGRFGSEANQVYDGLTDAKHLGGSTSIDDHGKVYGFWVWLLKAVNVKSMVDVGCGRGISTRWFMDHGADVLCVEGANDAINKSYLPRDRVVAHDFSLGPYWPEKTYDLAWCVEVLEHVPRQYMKNYQAIFHKSAIIIVSHSFWGGHHHVEVHPSHWWIQRMEMQGFRYSITLTRQMRAIVAATKLKFGTSQGQHLTGSGLVFLNPKVASLPQHSHLMGMYGCYRQKGLERPCKDPSDNVADEFLPVLRTPTQWDIIEIPQDQVYAGTGLQGASTNKYRWDMSLTNREGSKCRDDYPPPTISDGCDNLGGVYSPK